MIRKRIMTACIASFCLGLTACAGGGTETTGVQTTAETAVIEQEESLTAAEAETAMLEETSTAAEEIPVRVCVVYAGSGEGSLYNELCSTGAKQAAGDFEIELDELTGISEEEWEANVLTACEGGYDLVIGASPEIGDYIAKYGSEFPDTDFAVIDVTVDLPNVQSVYFEEKEGFFLAGAAAAMFAKQSEVSGPNGETVIGWIGGMKLPILQDYFSGYEQGAKYVDPEIVILENYVGDWNDPEEGRELAKLQTEQGAEVVLQVAYGTGEGVAESAEKVGISVIDTDWMRRDGKSEENSILASISKRADKACYLLVQSVAEGTFEGGTIRYLSLKDGGIELQAGERMPQEIAGRCDEIAEQIAAGEIIVGEDVQNSSTSGEDNN